MTVICSYAHILCDRNFLPVFISFKVNNKIQFNLPKKLTKIELNNLLKIAGSWFSELKVEEITYA